MPDVKRICIVRLGAFGDIIHTLPLATDLHRCGWSIDWLCEDRWACIIDGSPCIERIHTLPKARWKREHTPLRHRLADLRRLRRALQQRDYEAVIDAQGLAKSAILARLAGRSVIGHRRPRAREGSHLLHRRSTPCTAEHVIDQQRALGLALTGPAHPGGDWHFALPAWSDQQQTIDDWLMQQDLERPWALNVGAGWPTKIWPEHRQQDFLERVAARGLRPLIIWGGPSEQAVATRLQSAVPAAIMAPPTTIPELACLLRRCALLVSGDTGPLHLARAVGCPAIGLFGPVPAGRNGVRGPHWANLQAPGADWERHDVSKVHMDQISADAVIALAAGLL